MQKTVTIDGKQVNLRTSGLLPRLYKSQFKQDYFADFFKLSMMTKLDKVSKGTAKKDDFELIDFDFFYNVIWCMARLADKDIPDPDTWFDSFDAFPIFELLPEILELITKSLEIKKNTATMKQFVASKK